MLGTHRGVGMRGSLTARPTGLQRSPGEGKARSVKQRRALSAAATQQTKRSE